MGKLIRIGPVAGPSTERVNRAAHRWTDLRVRGRNAYLAGLSAQVDREKHGGGRADEPRSGHSGSPEPVENKLATKKDRAA